MDVLKKNLDEGIVELILDDEEDSWYLSHILSEGDHVEGVTERKIKIGREDNQRVKRKKVRLNVEVEKTEYTPSTKTLRALGRIKDGPEDIDLGSYHSFNLKKGSEITIIKDEWPSHHLRKLEEAVKPQGLVLMILLERDKAFFGLLKKKGYEKLLEMTGDVQKKRMDNHVKGDFYEEVKNKITDYNERYEPTKIILASPAFWKEYLYKQLPDYLKKKVLQAKISNVDSSSFNELIKRPEVKTALEDDRTRFEMQRVEEVLRYIEKDQACYGLEDCKEKTEIGAVEKMLVSDTFMKEKKDDDDYEEVDDLLQTIEDMNGEIIIITKDEPRRKLDGLGGIAGKLRWEV